MATSSRASGTTGQPVLYEGPLLKPGAVPGQWSMRYFVLMPLQRELVLKWWPDKISRLSGQSPTGCLYLRASSKTVMKASGTVEVSGVHNPEKPLKRTYCLKSSATHRVDDFMFAVQNWLSAHNSQRSLSFSHVVDLSASDERSPRHSSEEESAHFTVRALFGYTASDNMHDELSFPSGATIRVFEQADSGWWRGVDDISCEHGWFPSNFVRPVSSRVVTNKPDVCNESVLFYAIATNYYEADSSAVLKELTLRPDDAIAVTVTHTNGWWFGTSGSCESGWFPSNHVEILK